MIGETVSIGGALVVRICVVRLPVPCTKWMSYSVGFVKGKPLFIFTQSTRVFHFHSRCLGDPELYSRIKSKLRRHSTYLTQCGITLCWVTFMLRQHGLRFCLVWISAELPKQGPTPTIFFNKTDILAFIEVVRLFVTSKIKIATGRPAWCLESRLAAGFLQGGSKRAGKFHALQGPSRNFCIWEPAI